MQKPYIIIEAAARTFSVEPAMILSLSREKSVVDARYIAMYLCKTMLNMSYREIATSFNIKDFGYAAHACQQIDKGYKNDPETFLSVERVKHLLYSVPGFED